MDRGRLDLSGFFQYPEGEFVEQPEELGFLAHASEEDWAKVLAATQTRRFAAGEVLIRVGQEDRSLKIVMSGTLEVVAEHADGSESRLERREAPTVLGEIAFVAGGPASATVRAVTDGEALQLDFEAYEALAARQPRLGRQILLDLARILAIRLRDAVTQSR